MGEIVVAGGKKSGVVLLARMQFLRTDHHRLALPRVAVNSQPCSPSMTLFSYLLQRKIALLFPVKQPLFSKKRQICPSLLAMVARCNFEAHSFSIASAVSEIFAEHTQGVTDHCLVSGSSTFCSVFWLFGDVEYRDLCRSFLRKVVVFVR